ncbi:hypothetical protein [Alkalihalobacterium elongatum]|uniref:hypothetical protein n=1 Tax=Alkalihalobacterium elongatum TaxID=2675466 RepID=UPI001C200143|nr:hypothetical protein [Alkalihalobacterium elongatum]
MAVLRVWVFFKRKKNVGYTLFVPTGVRHQYPEVNLKEQKVIGTVIYKNRIYMKVFIDLKEDTVNVEGSVDELGDLSMAKETYIDMFKREAKFFVENKISNPEKYYEEK